MQPLCAALLACATVRADGGGELGLSELIELLVRPAAVEAEKPGFSSEGAPRHTTRNESGRTVFFTTEPAEGW